MLNGKSPAAVAVAAQQQYNQHMAQSVNYPSQSHLRQSVPILATNIVDRPFDDAYVQAQVEQKEEAPGSQRSGSSGSVKAFACTTCGKGFARRSDLARHGEPILEKCRST